MKTTALILAVLLLRPLAGTELRTADGKYRYRQGETIVFQADFGKEGAGKKFTGLLSGHRSIQRKITLTADASGRAEYRFTPEFPLTVILRTAGRGRLGPAVCAAAAAPEDLTPPAPPADFAAFLERERQRTAAVPLTAELFRQLPGKPADKFRLYEAEVPLPSGEKWRVLAAVPANATPRTLPGMVIFHDRQTEHLHPVRQEGWFTLSAAVLPGPELPPGERRRRLFDPADPEKPGEDFFAGVRLRALLAVQLAALRPEWDGKLLAVRGKGLGAWQAIAAAALDNRVTACAAALPAPAHPGGAAAGGPEGWPHFSRCARYRAQPGALAAETAYLETAHYLRAAADRCQFRLAAVLTDREAPATGIFTAVNALPADRRSVYVITGRERRTAALIRRDQEKFLAGIRKNPVRR